MRSPGWIGPLKQILRRSRLCAYTTSAIFAEESKLKTWRKILPQTADDFADCPKVARECPPLDNPSRFTIAPATQTQWAHQLRWLLWQARLNGSDHKSRVFCSSRFGIAEFRSDASIGNRSADLAWGSFSFSRSRLFPYRTANTSPVAIIPNGGNSITKIARLIARCASFGVAFAVARHMAHPCAKAGAVQNATSNITASPYFRANFISLHPKIHNSAGIREEEEIHDDEARHHGKCDHPAHQRRLKLQMHEVPDDQRRLDHRQNQQDLQHAHRLEYLPVSEHHLNRRQDQQRSPHPEVLPLAVVMLCDIVHRFFSVILSVPCGQCSCEILGLRNPGIYEILVDIKYTSGKMNIHTRSTKCQYNPETSTSCAS